MLRPLCLLLLALLLPAAEPAAPSATPAIDTAPGSATSPLAPIRTDTPRDCMKSFLRAMDRHAAALAAGDPQASAWLDDAVRCLDLSRTNPVSREQVGRETASLLKETIDRVIAVDLARVPDDPALLRWQLRGTEITIIRLDEGERRGEHLFSADTVERTPVFFSKVRHLPLLPGASGGGWRQPWQERYVPEPLKPQVFGIAYWQWLLITLLVFVGLLLRQFARLGGYVLKRLTSRTSATWDDELVDALVGPVTHLATTGVWFASLHLLGITGTAYTVIAFLIKGAFFVNLAYLAYKIAGFLGHLLERRLREKHEDLNQGLLRLLRQTLKIVALVFCLLLGAQNMGMDVASLIAGLGIGGLAVALAAKDTLANFFGSVMLMLDRPFKVGDYVVAKGCEGTVEEIGFRSTRLRTPHNSLVSIPNSELVLANIDNLGARPWRRVKATLGLVYGTPPERIEAFLEGVKNAIKANPRAKPDAIHVALEGLGASSLDVLVLYHLVVPDWNGELLERQRIWLEILRVAEAVGVQFAFPTQTLHIESLPGQPSVAAPPAGAGELARAAAGFGPGGAAARPAGQGIFTPRHLEVATAPPPAAG